MAQLKKYKLTDWDDESPSTHVLGISSALPDYKLAFVLNKILGNLFFNTPCLYTVSSKKDQKEVYQCFKSNGSHLLSDVYLFVNQSVYKSDYSDNGSLFGDINITTSTFIPRLSKWDYLLISNDIRALSETIYPAIYPIIKTIYLFDFKYFNKNEQLTLTTFYYENKC